MRKLTPVTDDPIVFIDSVIDKTKKRKDDDKYDEEHQFKGRCKALFAAHKNYIERYKTEFNTDTLENLVGKHPDLTDTEKKELQSLYSYNRTPIKNLRNQVLTEDGYLNEFCPLCGVNLVATMDHYIPQEDYPLFVVHPLNLIPCCCQCNGSKSNRILENGVRKFWNVYLDTPPKDEYLKCDVKKGLDGIVDVDFRLEQGKIPDKLFHLLEHTMGKDGQKVLSIYKKASGKIISKFINQVEKYVKNNSPKRTFGDCIKDFKEMIEGDFVTNDYESVIKQALINSPIFYNNLKERLMEESVPFVE